MPSIPTNSLQVAVVLLLVLPGTVYQFVRSRLRGPAPDDASALNRILRALGTSALLASLYVIVAGPWLARLIAATGNQARITHDLRWLGLWAFVLLFVMPAILAVLDHFRRLHLRLDWLRLSYDPTFPDPWDFAFDGLEECYVRILTDTGRWIGGYWGAGSWVSSYPEPHAIYISTAHNMMYDGKFGDAVPDSSGMYVRCEDIRLIEFISPTAATVGHDGTDRPEGVPVGQA